MRIQFKQNKMKNNLTRDQLEAVLLQLGDECSSSCDVAEKLIEEWFPEDVAVTLDPETALDLQEKGLETYVIEVYQYE